MPTVDNLDIQISTSLKQSDKQLDNLIKKLNTVSSSLSKLGTSSSKVSSGTSTIATSATKSTKSFKGLASAFGKFYASYFLVIRGIKGLYKSIEGTANYLEAFNYFEVSFNKIANEWKRDYSKFGYDSAEAYAESFSKRAKESLSKLSGVQVVVGADGKGLLTETGMKNLGLNIQEITQYASQLASVTNSIGQTGEVSLRTSNAFTKLAGDISSLFNQDYSAVAKNLQSGLIGQSRALYKYGIDITNATLQTYAYNLGIEKNVSEMTQAEKMQLRMIAILEQSKVAWGDLANTINSPSNMLRQFKNNLKEAGMMLGQLFIPLLQRVLPVINGATIAIKNLLGNIAGFLGIKLDLDAFGQSGSDMFDDMSDSMEDVAESAKKAKSSLRGFDELKTISSGSGSSNLENTLDLTEEIIKATEEYEKVWQKAYDKMQQRAQKFAKAFEKYFKPVEKIFEDIAKGDWFAVGQDVSKLAAGILDFFSRAIESVDWQKVGHNVGEFLRGIDWKEVVYEGFRLAFNIAEAIADVWFESFETAPIETAIITALALAKFSGLGAALSKSMSAAIVSGGGLTLSVQAVTITGLLAFGLKLGTEKEELIKNIEEKGYEEGKKASGNQAMDKIALYDYETKKAEHDVTLQQVEMVKKAADKIEKHNQNIQSAQTNIALQQIEWVKKLGQGIKKIFGFETGGFPQSASLFWANENGVPELVGTMGGKTAVASGMEITGIKDAIMQSSDRDARLMERNNQLLSLLLEKEYGITDDQIGKSAQRYARDYFNRTGNDAYSF